MTSSKRFDVLEATVPQRFRSAAFSCYLPAARFVGLDPYPILRNAGIDPRLLEDAQSWLPAPAVAKILEQSAALSGRDDFAIMIAECQTLATLGPVALLVEHERSVRDIIQAAIEFRSLISDAITIGLQQYDGTADIAFEIEPSSPQLASLVVSSAYNILIDAVEGAWRPSTIHFRQSAPRRLATYTRFFQCPIHFDDGFDGFSCDSATLDRPNPSAQPTLASYARSLLYLTPEMDLSSSFTERVKSSILLLLRHGSPTLHRTADALGMSSRSVQRRLAAEGHSFEKILNDVRKRLSTRYLGQSAQSISEVAYNSGFSSVSAFSRWFGNEFNLSPSKWRSTRRQLLGESMNLGPAPSHGHEHAAEAA